MKYDIINLGKCANIGTHWVVIYNIKGTATFFDSFADKHTPRLS